MLMFWTLKLSFDVEILFFFGLLTVLATFWKSSGHPGQAKKAFKSWNKYIFLNEDNLCIHY
jgi:hypothetical protein